MVILVVHGGLQLMQWRSRQLRPRTSRFYVCVAGGPVISRQYYQNVVALDPAGGLELEWDLEVVGASIQQVAALSGLRPAMRRLARVPRVPLAWP